MIGRLLVSGVLAVVSAAAQENVQHTILAWFRDGAGVELCTRTTGPTQQTSVQGAGMIWHNIVNRVVVDSQNRTVFAYELEAERAPEPGAVTIRVKPVSSEVGGFPTVSAAREFRSVRRGQEVKIEILANPATGERVYDVLRPTDEPNPYPGSPVIRAVERPWSGDAAKPEVRVVLNGKAVPVRSNWTAGKPARLYLPGHGGFYLSWEKAPRFQLAGYIEKNRLIFLLDSYYVEITCGSNILTTTERGPVWIYHDPHYTPRPQDGAHGAELAVADDLEALNAKK